MFSVCGLHGYVQCEKVVGVQVLTRAIRVNLCNLEILVRIYQYVKITKREIVVKYVDKRKRVWDRRIADEAINKSTVVFRILILACRAF